MKRDDADALADRLMEVIVRRRSLGGYSPDAADLLLFAQVLYEMVRHLRDAMPLAPKKRK